VTRQTAPLKSNICIHSAGVLFDREQRVCFQWRILPIFAVQSVPTENSDKSDSFYGFYLDLENCYTSANFAVSFLPHLLYKRGLKKL